jgi:ferredoxin
VSERAVGAEVDHDLCAGVAMCLQQAPGAFALDVAGQSVFRPSGAWTGDDLDRAAEACPMEAITVLRRAEPG